MEFNRVRDEQLRSQPRTVVALLVSRVNRSAVIRHGVFKIHAMKTLEAIRGVCSSTGNHIHSAVIRVNGDLSRRGLSTLASYNVNSTKRGWRIDAAEQNVVGLVTPSRVDIFHFHAKDVHCTKISI